jgi:hypothetical protein
VPGGTTAHMLAPSKEALDTPLSPPPLSNEPGSATGLSGDYPDGTRTRWSSPACRTQHVPTLSAGAPISAAGVPADGAPSLLAGTPPATGLRGCEPMTDPRTAAARVVFDRLEDLLGAGSTGAARRRPPPNCSRQARHGGPGGRRRRSSCGTPPCR